MNEPSKSVFGERLRDLRNKKKINGKKISYQYMADFLEITRSAYGLYEQKLNYPSVDKLIKLADFFDVSTDYLLGRSNSKFILP